MSRMLSIIMPIFNGARFIDAAMECLAKIKYSPLEIIVVDDGSTDDSAQIVSRQYPDVILLQQENKGPALARNYALQVAQGDYIAFLDVDDLYPDGATDLLMGHLIKDTSLGAVYGKVKFRALGGADDRIDKMGFSPEDNFAKFHYNLGAMIVRKDVFEKIGDFPPTRFSEDVDFHLRLSQSGLKTKRVDVIALIYQLHEDNMTRELQDTGGKLNPEFLLAIRKAILRRRSPKQE